MARLTSLSRSVEGARVLVTGAASGMGRATACLFADEGARVFLADWSRDALTVVVDEISGVHGDRCAGSAQCDVSDDSDRRWLVDEAVAAMGGVDVLINNAGISRPTSVHADDMSFTRGWDETLAVNLSAHAHLVRLCLPWLEAAPAGGRVVNIASTEALVATRGLSAYTASKHGVIGLTKGLAVELGRRNVTVNAVCPGPILTGMTAGIPEESKMAYARKKVPLGRYGDPEEVAHMTLSLCLPAASFVNGAALVVDGGMSVSHS
ncbi:MAG: hypothetical protein RLY50_899 [Actinomycetota bacterium]